MAVRRDRALLLRRSPFGESSLVVHAITPSDGRVHILAKGAYRPTSGYYAVLDLFDTLELEWWRSERAELDLLRKGDVLVRRRHLTRDLERYRAAQAVLELIELASHPVPGVGDPVLYDLAEGGLDLLCREATRPEALLLAFEVAFLANLGLSPMLRCCIQCGSPAPAGPGHPARAYFSAALGGRLCPSCALQAKAEGQRVGTLPTAVLDAVASLQGLTLEQSLQRVGSGLERGQGRRLEQARVFGLRFLEYHLESLPRIHRGFLAAHRSHVLAAP